MGIRESISAWCFDVESIGEVLGFIKQKQNKQKSLQKNVVSCVRVISGVVVEIKTFGCDVENSSNIQQNKFSSRKMSHKEFITWLTTCFDKNNVVLYDSMTKLTKTRFFKTQRTPKEPDKIVGTVNMGYDICNYITIPWQGHFDRVMQLNWLYFRGICQMMDATERTQPEAATINELHAPSYNFQAALTPMY